ncbi:MAG TPA: COX15/CtaA family protein, partial [Stellaceae bacterium]|nr:COX15/CtaA family protein [Stellaceae bacterium]
MIFAMVVIGGVTRLTWSGLSITEWQPVTGAVPPLSAADWQAEFAKYQQTLQYKLLNAGMSLADFKTIYLWEYVHRLWGRLIGFVYLLPFLYFLARGRIPRRLAWPLAGIFALGAAQGALGWYMVESGLADRAEVSQYRLVAHLALALAIYGAILWVALGLLRESASVAFELNGPAPHPLLPRSRERVREGAGWRRAANVVIVLVAA